MLRESFLNLLQDKGEIVERVQSSCLAGGDKPSEISRSQNSSSKFSDVVNEIANASKLKDYMHNQYTYQQIQS